MVRDAAYLILFHLKKYFKKMREERNKIEFKKQQQSLNKNPKNRSGRSFINSKGTSNIASSDKKNSSLNDTKKSTSSIIK